MAVETMQEDFAQYDHQLDHHRMRRAVSPKLLRVLDVS